MSEGREGILGGFAGWLRQRRLAPEHRTPYLERWVHRFLRLASARPRESWQDTLRVFLEDLDEGGTPDWQIRQAAEAVSLYCGQFRQATGPRGAEPTVAPEPGQIPGASASSAAAPASQGHTTAPSARVSASTQNQAYNALLFLHRHVLQVDLGDTSATIRARRGRKLPVVLSADEVRAVLAQLTGSRRLMIELIYGGGLRLSELTHLRVKDIDFDAATITVRSGKGDQDRVTLLPRRLQPDLQSHLQEVKTLHERDLAAGAGEAPLPYALRRKYPAAGRAWPWQL